MHCVDLRESFPTNIYYLLATIGFNTAENEPRQVCGTGRARESSLGSLGPLGSLASLKRRYWEHVVKMNDLTKENFARKIVFTMFNTVRLLYDSESSFGKLRWYFDLFH